MSSTRCHAPTPGSCAPAQRLPSLFGSRNASQRAQWHNLGTQVERTSYSTKEHINNRPPNQIMAWGTSLAKKDSIHVVTRLYQAVHHTVQLLLKKTACLVGEARREASIYCWYCIYQEPKLFSPHGNGTVAICKPCLPPLPPQAASHPDRLLNRPIVVVPCPFSWCANAWCSARL